MCDEAKTIVKRYRRNRRIYIKSWYLLGVSIQSIFVFVGYGRRYEVYEDEALWYIMFADDAVLVDKNTNVSKDKLKRWQKVFEKNELKINKTNIEFLQFRFNNMIGGNGSNHNTRLGSQLINKMVKFKYLGSIVDLASMIRCYWIKC